MEKSKLVYGLYKEPVLSLGTRRRFRYFLAAPGCSIFGRYDTMKEAMEDIREYKLSWEKKY